MAGQPHVLVIPFPAQGHAGPLMKLSAKIAEHGIKVTFVTTERMHDKIMASADKSSLITVVPIPDGLDPHSADRKDLVKVMETMSRVMPGYLKSLIEKANESPDCEGIRCVIASISVEWALEVAQEMGIARAAVIPYSPTNLDLLLHVPDLVEAGLLDANGDATSDEPIMLSEGLLPWKRNEYFWTFPSSLRRQKMFFDGSSDACRHIKAANWVLCNSFDETPVSGLIPNILPIGPFLTSEHSTVNFWTENLTCLSWLDQQATGSVIYVSFGSVAILSQQQVDELAFGLESSNQPFLWVFRPDFVDTALAKLPDGFVERVSDRGMAVEWAPQERVLAHPSVACFLSHCGWNSTIEGISMGVPFLCWPSFGDQYQNRNYICDAWRIGLQFAPDENGIITRQEIAKKAKMLLNDDGIKENSMKLKERARRSLLEGGSSFTNFEIFVSQIKALR